MQTPPIEKLPRRPKPPPGPGKATPPGPPPRPPGTRKVKDGKTKKSDYFIYGFAVGMVIGQLLNMAIQNLLVL